MRSKYKNLSKMGSYYSTADTLTPNSRNFLEMAKAKAGVSVIMIAFSLALLGLCSEAGAQSAAAKLLYNNPNVVTDYQSLNIGKTAVIGGYGFASFCYILACLLVLIAGIVLSPFIRG